MYGRFVMSHVLGLGLVFVLVSDIRARRIDFVVQNIYQNQLTVYIEAGLSHVIITEDLKL